MSYIAVNVDWLKEHDAQIRTKTLDEVIKMTALIEESETERWERFGRNKNDGYINGTHSGYGRALKDLRRDINLAKEFGKLKESK